MVKSVYVELHLLCFEVRKLTTLRYSRSPMWSRSRSPRRQSFNVKLRRRPRSLPPWVCQLTAAALSILADDSGLVDQLLQTLKEIDPSRGDRLDDRPEVEVSLILHVLGLLS